MASRAGRTACPDRAANLPVDRPGIPPNLAAASIDVAVVLIADFLRAFAGESIQAVVLMEEEDRPSRRDLDAPARQRRGELPWA